MEKPDAAVQEWLQAIAAYETTFKKWEMRVEKILKKYKDEGRSVRDTGSKFNILWSNVQTIVPACFSRLPKPSVTRRYKDADPVGRIASILLERALEYEVEYYPDYRTTMKNVVNDRFLGGRGVAWARYEPHIQAKGIPDDGVQITEDADEGEIEGEEEITNECAPVDYVHWKDFGHKVARTWEEVPAVWRKVYMTRDMLEERFGEDEAKRIPLDTRPDEQKKAGPDAEYQAVIYEIWDKEDGKAIWLSKSLGEIIDERDDPLKLEGFFPCPKPLYATLTSDSLVPVPDYTLYQDQAQALDILSDRIDGLIKALQVKGVYDASIPELARLFTEAANGDMIPVKNWLAFVEKQGLKGAIDLVELMPIAQALGEAYKAFAQIKQEIYEITGLSDIIRGSSDPRETATAQKMKGQFGSMRLRTMQNDVGQFAQDLLQLKAQIICQQFQPKTIQMMSGAAQLSPEDQAMIPQALALLKDNPLRGFRIEIEADSLIFADEQQEKTDRMEFLRSAGQFVEQVMKLSQESPIMAPVALDMLKFSITSFKVGKELEGGFDTLADKLKQAAAQPQPPKQDPVLVKAQADMQLKQAEMQMKQQMDQQSMQATLQMEQQKAQLEMQTEQHRQQVQAQEVLQQNQLEAQRAQLQIQAENEKIMAESDLKWRIAQLQAETQVIVARISADAKEKSDQIKAATSMATSQGNSGEESGESETGVALTTALQGFQEAIARLSQPRTIIRGPDGRVAGIQ